MKLIKPLFLISIAFSLFGCGKTDVIYHCDEDGDNICDLCGRDFSYAKELEIKIDDNEFNENTDSIKNEIGKRLNFFNIVTFNIEEVDSSTLKLQFGTHTEEILFVIESLSYSPVNTVLTSEMDVIIENPFIKEDIRIEYYEDVVPVLILPVKSDAKVIIEDYISSHLCPDTITRKVNDEIEEVIAVQPDLFLWTDINKEKFDFFEFINSEILKQSLFLTFYSSSIWCEFAQDSIQFIFGNATENYYYFSDSKNANFAASCTLCKLKSSPYQHKITISY